jgi:hypothetical protein
MMHWLIIEEGIHGKVYYWHWSDPTEEVKRLRQYDKSKTYTLYHLNEIYVD